MKLLPVALFAAIAFGQYTYLGEFCTSATGTDAYACTPNASVISYQTGSFYIFKADVANTGTASFNAAGLGAKTIVIAAGGVTTTLSDNAIRAGQIVVLQYDGTNMQMQSTSGIAPQASGLSLLIANNLSDVNSQSTALTNLLGSSIIPIANGGAVAQGSNICGTADSCASGNLTQAQIVSLTSTGSSWINLISAPAAGSMAVVDYMLLEQNYNGTAYAGGSNIQLFYGTSSSVPAESQACSLNLLTNTSKTFCAGSVQGINAGNSTNYVAKAIAIGISGTAFTCSGTCGALYYWIKYHVMTGIQ